ncbi:hypothetical protein NKH48_03185 [Mesorhizobium sp. M1233]|uniref:hypothetical protein n=1 Tax=Mesorhizobium sp. M1233 TaxID=2957072 RepID=UPI00333788E0
MQARDGNRFLPPECLPPSGVVVLCDGTPAGASFVYLPNAAIAYIAFTCVNPALPGRVRIEAARRAIEGVITIAEGFLGGRGFIEMPTHYRSLHNIALDLGFADGGKVHTAFRLVGDGIDPDMLK